MRASLALAPTVGAHVRRGRILRDCAAASRATGPGNRNGCATGRGLAVRAHRKSFTPNRFGPTGRVQDGRRARAAHTAWVVTFVSARAKFVHRRRRRAHEPDRDRARALPFHLFFE